MSSVDRGRKRLALYGVKPAVFRLSRCINLVGLGFVASLARPGGNITGLNPEVTGKRLELLKELVPGMVKVAVFRNPNDPGAQFSLTETQSGRLG